MKLTQLHIILFRRPFLWLAGIVCFFLVISGIPQVKLADSDEDTYIETNDWSGTIKEAGTPEFVHVNKHPWHRKGHMLVRKRSNTQQSIATSGTAIDKQQAIATAAVLLMAPKPRNTLPRPFYYIHLFLYALF